MGPAKFGPIPTGTGAKRADGRSLGRLRTSEGHMTPDIYKRVSQDRRFRDLVAKRSRFAWILSAMMLVIYFGFIFIIAFAPKSLGVPLAGGVTTVGIPLGLFVIISAFVLTGIYVRRANSEFDALTREIVEEAK
jgi:uncharacterized membrane protein (DUF485 family)